MVKSCPQRTRSRLIALTGCRRWAVGLTALSFFYGNFSMADHYVWSGPGSWSDAKNWTNLTNANDQSVPGGDDVVFFGANDSSATIHQAHAVSQLQVISGSVAFMLAGGTVNVGSQNLFIVEGGAMLDLDGEGGVHANGTNIGRGGSGDISIGGGAHLSDSYQLTVGYSDHGELSIADIGSVTAKQFFVGGFESGNGEVALTGDRASLTSTDFMVVGNLGTGNMQVHGGARVSSGAEFYIAGFEGSNGTVFLTDSDSSLQASGQLLIGYAGMGRMNLDNGATASAKGASIGTNAGADGKLTVQHAGSRLDVNNAPLIIGEGGKGSLEISFSGSVAVQGDGSYVTLGSEEGGNGLLLVQGENAKLIASNGSLTVGMNGSGKLHVVGHGSVDVRGLSVGSGDGTQSLAEIDGAGSFVQAHEFAKVGTEGNATLSVRQGGRLMSQTGSVGVDGEGIVTLEDQGSMWQVKDELTIGEMAKGTLIVSNGGKVSAATITLGSEPGSEGSLTLDGSNAKLDATSFEIGVDGKAEVNVRNGATHTFVKSLFLDSKEGSKLSVTGNGSAVEFSELFLGSFNSSQDTGILEVNSGARANISGSVVIRTGEMRVGTGGAVTVSGLVDAGFDEGNSSTVSVAGVGARLESTGGFLLGGEGVVTMRVDDGGTVVTSTIDVSNRVAGTSATIITVEDFGASLNADKFLFSGTGGGALIVNDGGHVNVNTHLRMGTAALNLNGGTVTVGLGIPEANTVSVGPGGHFSSASRVPNIRHLGGVVQAGNSPGVLDVEGDYLQDPGATLRFSIAGDEAGTEYSQLTVGGNLQLFGKLQFSFEDGFEPFAGQTFDVIALGGTSQVSGVEIEVKNLAPGFAYSFAPFVGGYRLTALSDGQYITPGDYNLDGTVDAADYVIWRKGRDTIYTDEDYVEWRAHFGTRLGNDSSNLGDPARSSAIPEPTRAWLVISIAAIGLRRRLG